MGKIPIVKAGDDFNEMEDRKPHYTPRDPRAIGHRQRTIFTDEDFDNLAEASKEKSAILLYRRKRNLSVQVPDIGHVVHFENVTANNYLCPLTILQLRDKINSLRSNLSKKVELFQTQLSCTELEFTSVEQLTTIQSKSVLWN